jgi:hypothetical protein
VFAQRRTRGSDRALDFVQDAYVLLRTGHRSWDLEKQPDFFAFACGVIASLISNDQQSWAARHERSALPDDGDGEPAGPPSQPNPEQLVAMKERSGLLGRVRERVRESFAEGELERKLHDEDPDGASEESAESEAARHGVTTDRIYAARAKIKYAKKRNLLDLTALDRMVGGTALERRDILVLAEDTPGELEWATRAVLAMSEADVEAELARGGIDLEKEKALVGYWNGSLAAARDARAVQDAAEAARRARYEDEERVEKSRARWMFVGGGVAVVIVVAVVVAFISRH